MLQSRRVFAFLNTHLEELMDQKGILKFPIKLMISNLVQFTHFTHEFLSPFKHIDDSKWSMCNFIAIYGMDSSHFHSIDHKSLFFFCLLIVVIYFLQEFFKNTFHLLTSYFYSIPIQFLINTHYTKKK